MLRKLIFLQVVLSSAFLNAQGISDLNTMRDYFRKEIADGPYTFLQSPRTGLGVGTVYMVQDKMTIFYTRPDNCFTPDTLAVVQKSDTMKVSNFNSTSKYSLDIGLKVANAGPITDDVKSEFQKKGASKVVVKIPYLKRQLLTLADLRQAIRNGMDADCRAAFTEGKPPRWLILEALYTDNYSVSFENSGGNNVSISAGILKILFPSFKFDNSKESSGTLEFSDQPYIVAVKSVKVDRVIKFGAGDIPLSVVEPDKYYNVVSARTEQ